jgi:Uma2 family endonuclease
VTWITKSLQRVTDAAATAFGIDTGAVQGGEWAETAPGFVVGPHTLADWRSAETDEQDRFPELIAGHLFAEPMPTGTHQFVRAQLTDVIAAAVRPVGLYAVTAVGVEISSGWRTALIPDIAVLNSRPIEATFLPEQIELVVEIWSPGNTKGERQTKAAAYAGADVMFLWTVEFDRFGAPTLTAHRLCRGEYVVDTVAKPGTVTTIDAAPVPVSLDPATLLP